MLELGALDWSKVNLVSYMARRCIRFFYVPAYCLPINWQWQDCKTNTSQSQKVGVVGLWVSESLTQQGSNSPLHII